MSMSAMAPIAALLFSVAIIAASSGLQGVLLPVRAQIEAFSTLDLALLGSAYYVGFASGCLVGSRLIRRAGHIRAFAAMAAIGSAVALAHALVLSPIAWWPLRAITGFCLAILFIVIESWLNEQSKNESRGVVLAIYTATNYTFLTLGQLMIMLFDPAAFPLFAVASIMVSLAAVPVLLSVTQAPAPIETSHLRISYLFHLSPVGFVGCCAVGAANGSFWSLGPFFAERSGLSVGGIALFMSATAIGGALGQWPFGRFSDKVDRRKVIAGICIAACVIAITTAVVNGRWPRSLLYFGFLFGVFAMPLYAICIAHMNDFVPADGFVEASCGLLLVYSAGAVCGPLLATVFVEWLGAVGLFVFTALAHACMAVFAIQRMYQRERPPDEERSDFVAVPHAVQNVFTIDPRADQTD